MANWRTMNSSLGVVGWYSARHDDGFSAQFVFEAVQTDGGAAFGRRRARAVLRVLAVRFDL
jgi:hypothetical protein